MELRYIIIFVAVATLAVIGGLIYQDHARKECRLEAIKSGMKAEDIAIACR